MHSEGVYDIVPMQECKDARQETVGSDLGGHRQLCGPKSQEDSIETVCKRRQDEEAKLDSKSITRFSGVLCNAAS